MTQEKMMTNSRHREKTEGPVYGEHHVYHGTVETGNPQVLMYSKVKSMDDHVVPDFHRRVASGEIINNPVDYTEHTIKADGGGGETSYNLADDTDVYTWSGDSQTQAALTYSGLASLDHLTTAVDTIDHALAKSKAIAGIDRTPYAFLEDLFEVRETIRFLKNPGKGLLKLSKSFSKTVKQQVRNNGLSLNDSAALAKEISKVWLEYRFAVSPLLRSASDAFDYLTTETQDVTKRRTARGFDSFADSANGQFRGFLNPSFPTNNFYDFEVVTERRRDVRSGILYEVTNPLNDVRFQLGLRNKDIPVGLWEILPYSFMVDRVLNISRTLRGLLNLLDPSVKILAGWSVEKDSRNTKYREFNHGVGGWSTQVQGDWVRNKTFRYTRETWTPSIADTVPVPELGNLYSSAASVADLFALIYSKFKLIS
jgi:hypothetical protein